MVVGCRPRGAENSLAIGVGRLPGKIDAMAQLIEQRIASASEILESAGTGLAKRVIAAA